MNITNSAIDQNRGRSLLAIDNSQLGSLALTGLNLTNANALHIAIVDSSGNQIVPANATPRTARSSQRTVITSSTNETTIVTAISAIHNDLVALIFANTSATATQVDIRDTTSGTIIGTIEVPATDIRGFAIAGESLPQTSVNTNWTAQCGTGVASLIVWAIYDKNS